MTITREQAIRFIYGAGRKFKQTIIVAQDKKIITKTHVDVFDSLKVLGVTEEEIKNAVGVTQEEIDDATN